MGWAACKALNRVRMDGEGPVHMATWNGTWNSFEHPQTHFFVFSMVSKTNESQGQYGMRRGCLWYSFYQEFPVLFLVPLQPLPPAKNIWKVVLYSCLSVSGSHLRMCLKRGAFLREGSQWRHLKRCPTVGRSTWGCSRHPCLGPFRPSLCSTSLGFCLVLMELQACTRDHNSTEQSLATVSPGMVSPKPTPSSLSPNMRHSLPVSLGWLLQAPLSLCKQH